MWGDSHSGEEVLQRIVHENALGLPTQSRAAAVAKYVLRPRFIAPGPEVPVALRAVLGDRTAFSDACYYEATRADALLGRFAEDAVFNWHEGGRLVVCADLVESWRRELAASKEVAKWSPALTRRVAQGLIATLRGFGRFVGAVNSPRKEIARPGISTGGFAYTAYRLHQQGVSSRGLLGSTVWRRWLLDDDRVDELMHRLASLGIVAVTNRAAPSRGSILEDVRDIPAVGGTRRSPAYRAKPTIRRHRPRDVATALGRPPPPGVSWAERPEALLRSLLFASSA